MPSTAQTRAALDESIAVWTERTTCTEPPQSIGGSSCPLCVLFDAFDKCGDCPVKLHTGSPACLNTNWSNAYRSLCHWRDTITSKSPEHILVQNRLEFHRAANVMLTMLKNIKDRTK